MRAFVQSAVKFGSEQGGAALAFRAAPRHLGRKQRTPPMDLTEAAAAVRQNAYAPYSNFKVGAAVKSRSGKVYRGCNVENTAYPEGTCAEAGAIAAMVAAGESSLTEVAVIADSPEPVTPCGGCRQKLFEFATSDAKITMASVSGKIVTMNVSDLLPGAFVKSQMEKH
ncbi:MAG: cytidine deaminase [Silicimonas sp.]|nr:cytidine deaminase [Silicimonas sp.]